MKDKEDFLMRNRTKKQKERLKNRILNEMMFSEKEQLEHDIWKEIGKDFRNYKEFKERFEKTYRKVWVSK